MTNNEITFPHVFLHKIIGITGYNIICEQNRTLFNINDINEISSTLMDTYGYLRQISITPLMDKHGYNVHRKNNNNLHTVMTSLSRDHIIPISLVLITKLLL